MKNKRTEKNLNKLRKCKRKPIAIRTKLKSKVIPPILQAKLPISSTTWSYWLQQQQAVDNIYKYQKKKDWKAQIKVKLISIIKTYYLRTWRVSMSNWGIDKLHDHLCKQCK